MAKHKFKLIAFDLDGVLADTTECHARAFGDLWAEIGIDGPAYDSIAGRRTRDVVAQLTADLKPTAKQIDDWVYRKQSRARHYLATVPIAYDDSVPCLAALAETDILLALATGASPETAAMILSRVEARERFSIVATAEDVSVGKPSPEIYLHVMARANVRPEQTLIIEDSVAGIASGIASGAHVACVRTGNRVDEDRFFGSFPDIRSVLAQLGVEVP